MFKLEKIIKYLLYFTLFIPPLVVARNLLFPFVSGKAYLFRLGVELSLFFWLILLIKKPEYRPNFKNPLIIAAILYILAMSITAFLGVDPLHSFFSEIERADGIIQYIHWFLYFLILISLLRKEEEWQHFLKAIVILAIIISLFAWGQMILLPSLYDAPEQPTFLQKIFFYDHRVSRLEGTFGNPDYLPAFLLFPLFYSFYFFLKASKNQRKKESYLWLSLAAFLFLTFLFTQTRGAYLGFLSGYFFLALFFFIFLKKKHRKLVFSLWLIILFLVSFWIFLYFLQGANLTENRLIKRVTDISLFGKKSTLANRLLSWKIALAGIKERPFFGVGPENFAFVFSRYYNPDIPEPWYDKVHNQFLQVLVEGGIFQFFFYSLLIFSVFYLIFKIFKREKELAIILFSLFLSFLVQDIFLFDTFPLYLGLWPFFAFVYFESEKKEGIKEIKEEKDSHKREKNFCWFHYLFLSFWSILILFLLIEFCWLPYKSNSLILKYHLAILNNNSSSQKYKLAQNYLKEAIEINSPFTVLDARKRSCWALADVLERTKKLDENLSSLANFVIEQAKIALKNHPYDPQIYYAFAIASFHYGKFDKSIYPQAIAVLEKARKDISKNRLEYVKLLGQIYLYQGEKSKAEELFKEYAYEIFPQRSELHALLGEVYFMEEKYPLALKEFDIAINQGYRIWYRNKLFTRYLATCRELGEFEKMKWIIKKSLFSNDKNPRNWLLLAITYKALGMPNEAKIAFEKAVKLRKAYQKYAQEFQ